MKTELNKFYTNFLGSAAKHISQAVDKGLSDKNLKDFMLWLLQENNPQMEDYLRMLGVAGSIELELKLFSQVLDVPSINNIAPYIGLLNAYFGYETISDNLGVGLAACTKKTNPTYAIQNQVLLHFNQIMINKINGSTESSQQLFLPINDLIKKISVNQKTLAPQQMQLFVETYIQHNKTASAFDLEHSFMAIIILNVATCLQLLDSMTTSLIYPMLKQSLIARYAAVNQLIKQANQASWQQLANWGLHSILTVPTLAYCIGALDKIKPYANFKIVINDGLLYSAMADAALLTRLLNDIGTRLLRMDNIEQKTLYKKFYAYSEHQTFDSIFSYLGFLSRQEAFILPLTRIRKDIQHGEFNIALDRLTSKPKLTDALQLFCQGIQYYCKLYQQKHQQMLSKLNRLNDLLGDDQASKIILHFVQFHEYKYSFAYESPQGDYAITRSK